MSKARSAGRPIEPNAIYRFNDVLEILNISIDTLFKILREGKIRSSKPSGTRFFSGKDLIAFYENSAKGGTK
jgi:hypothetical protein